MSDYPERISISPTSRQKGEDDFFLVDRKAFPGKGTEYVRADRIEELEAKLAKAVKALKHIEHCDIHAPTHARNILKELTGGKNE